jgi:hypothetical protein
LASLCLSQDSTEVSSSVTHYRLDVPSFFSAISSSQRTKSFDVDPADVLFAGSLLRLLLINHDHIKLFTVETFTTLWQFQLSDIHHIVLADRTQHSCFLMVYRTAKPDDDEEEDSEAKSLQDDQPPQLIRNKVELSCVGEEVLKDLRYWFADVR